MPKASVYPPRRRATRGAAAARKACGVPSARAAVATAHLRPPRVSAAPPRPVRPIVERRLIPAGSHAAAAAGPAQPASARRPALRRALPARRGGAVSGAAGRRSRNRVRPRCATSRSWPRVVQRAASFSGAAPVEGGSVPAAPAESVAVHRPPAPPGACGAQGDGPPRPVGGASRRVLFFRLIRLESSRIRSGGVRPAASAACRVLIQRACPSHDDAPRQARGL